MCQYHTKYQKIYTTLVKRFSIYLSYTVLKLERQATQKMEFPGGSGIVPAIAQV